jgi:hypothetical protein
VVTSLVCLVLGVVAALLPAAARAQSAPQMLPYVHTIAAGTGVTYTPATLKGSTGTPVHGTSPGEGGPATAAALNGPVQLAVDSLGNLYITDSTGPVRKVDTSGNITTFAGGLSTGAGDCAASPTSTIGDGCGANETYLHSAYGIAIDPTSGDMYISENVGYRVRKISHSTYLMSSVVNIAGTKSGVDGDLVTCASGTSGCTGTAGTLNGPRGLAVDKHGNLYIMDEGNYAVRLANFATGQLTTVVNTSHLKEGAIGAQTCAYDATTGGVPAGTASLGVAGAIAFDSNDNLYITDSSCNYVFKVAENPATKMVDANSIMTVVIGSGLSTPAATAWTNQLGTALNFTPAGLAIDSLGNIYIGESTGTHVWFWDHATGYMHTVFGGGTSGSCFGVAGSGTSPYNGCDGIHSSLATTKGTGGLALDAWGDLYVSDGASFYVHKIAVGTSAPTVTANPNALLHLGVSSGGVSDSVSSINMTLAPDFSFVQQACTVNASTATPAGDNTQDCPFIVANTGASGLAQYEQVTVTGALGGSSSIPLTNQAYPTCQAATATSATVAVNGATPLTLGSQPGAACTGNEKLAVAPHSYSYTIVSQPVNGTLSGTGPAYTYTPTVGGNDSFTFAVIDNSAFAPAAVSYDGGQSTIVLETPTPLTGTTGTITFKAYVKPVANSQSVTASYNAGTGITLTGTDSNGATLIYAAVAPSHGTLSCLNCATPTYTPTNNYFGGDSFTFTVYDGVSYSSAATVTITVNPPPPTPTFTTLSVNYQTATPFVLTATGQGTISYALGSTPPSHGTLSGTPPNLTYTPTGTYSGADVFTYTVTNLGGNNTGTVNVTVQPAPAIPVAQNSTASVAFNTATQITAVAGGGNGNPLTYTRTGGPSHGTLSAFTGAVATYTPTTGYVGTDSFTFTASDGAHASNTGTVTIAVNQAAPVAQSQSVTTAFVTTANIVLVATGLPPITYSIVTQPAHGTLSGTAPNVTYTPGSNYAGADSFTFKANNGGDSNIATVSITVTPPSAPVPNSQSVTVQYQTATPITISGTGLGTITCVVTVQPSNGTLSGTAPAITYTPNSGYYGADSFKFTCSNPGGTSNPPGIVSLTVLPQPPVALPQSVTDSNNGVLPITLTATGNGTISYAVSAQPAYGKVAISGAVAAYTPNLNYSGGDSFTFTASNGSVSAPAKVTITVLPAPPVAQNISASTNFNTPAQTTLTATEMGTGAMTYTIVGQPANGTVTLAGSIATYTPATNFAGTDSYTFTATNSGGVSNIGTVTVSVGGGLLLTVASGGSFSSTVTNGQVAVYNLQISGWLSSAGVQVTLGCTGAPIICTTPNPVTLNGATPVPVTVSINTLPTSAAPMGVAWHHGMKPWVLMLSLLGMMILLPPARKRKTLCRVAMAIVAMAMFAGVSGCGGNIPEQPFGTPAGNYTYTLTATAATTAAGTPTVSQTLTLTVQ